jgi:hypothetical protein
LPFQVDFAYQSTFFNSKSTFPPVTKKEIDFLNNLTSEWNYEKGRLSKKGNQLSAIQG